ncbi:transglutaminase family protein [Pontixanthobacter aestiaquae]|uniref:Transglutaminase family protein n=1 Tax=Pontixanthobacter aestiaquae TaxID=1509367 RepID=A0A844ZAV9_9SPHN|nr:transglutaminase family protein [Pontixanthobacter aestiaquae]MDN3644840.1 transglutaminase family protein [Pontixanthobacter aestiaquae]MXO84157.1 transglutaminase family protein [Pontixanthobacter aestiaquae]
MRLSIRHNTRYRFREPVVHALQRLRLTPKETQGQKILDWKMSYENAEAEIEYDDQNFNTVTLVAVEPGAREVLISCEGLVDTEDNAGVIGRHSGHLPLWSFLGQTALTKPGPAVNKMLSDIGPQEGTKLDGLHALSERIRSDVAYMTGQTGVKTTAEEAASQGSGVCQDHAHIFIGAARAMDIPARYVSGYLMMNDRVEQDATHAWAEAHVDGLGWVGFDISNGISPDPRYVRVATGRDYRDASPITGITFGSSSEDLQVDVEVEQHQVQQ